MGFKFEKIYINRAVARGGGYWWGGGGGVVNPPTFVELTYSENRVGKLRQ